MEKVIYKFKSANKKKEKNSKLARKLYKINTLILITSDNNDNYSMDYEDEDYRIEIRTNINKNTIDQKSFDFKSKVTEDGSLFINTYLISNFDYRIKSKKVNGLFFKSKYFNDLVYITITFYPKRIESIGRFSVMQINIPKKKHNNKMKQNKLNTVSHIQIVQGGGCNGK